MHAARRNEPVGARRGRAPTGWSANPGRRSGRAQTANGEEVRSLREKKGRQGSEVRHPGDSWRGRVPGRAGEKARGASFGGLSR